MLNFKAETPYIFIQMAIALRQQYWLRKKFESEKNKMIDEKTIYCDICGFSTDFHWGSLPENWECLGGSQHTIDLCPECVKECAKVERGSKK